LTKADGLNYEELVDFFEDLEKAHGGKLKDEQSLKRITCTAPDLSLRPGERFR
jgi:hypothetical protein